MTAPGDRREDLRRNFDAFVDRAGDDPVRLLRLAKVAGDLNLWPQHDDLMVRAGALAQPGSALARMIRHRFNRRIPRWHFPMLHDDERNAAFDKAIRAAVRPGDRVLDIGSGSGLLAMMAARAGAASVISCEAQPAVAAMAAEIVAANGFAEWIRVIPRQSTDLDVEADLGGPVDVVISEVLSANLVGEGVQATMEDATGRLLRPGGRLVPASADIVVALAEWTDLKPVGQASGFDLGPFNRLRQGELGVDGASDALLLRSEPAVLFAFDFAEAARWRSRNAELGLVSRGGRINGVVQWLRVRLDATTSYANPPGTGFRSHWAPLFHPFDMAITPAAGERVTLGASHDSDAVAIWQVAG
jgi:type II protein arginine methyltransferase